MSFDVTCDRRKLAGWTCTIHRTLNSMACTVSYRNSPSLMSVMQVNRHGKDFDKFGARLGGTLHFAETQRGTGAYLSGNHVYSILECDAVYFGSVPAFRRN